MDFGMIIRSIFEIALIAGTLWAVFHEERIAALEERMLTKFRRRRFKVVGGCVSRSR